MTKNNEKEKKEKAIEELAKRRGFFWPSFEIYGGVSGFYTYGPLGTLLKKRVEQFILDYYVHEENCVAVEAPVLTTEEPWIASGHVQSFTDMTIECKKCGEPYRADHLLEEHASVKTEGMSLNQIAKQIEKYKVKCPKCKGDLGNVYDYNLMFRTEIGPGKSRLAGVLRPETAQTTYMPFKRLFEVTRKKLPMGVIQIGKSFRNEISPRQALVRLREFTQAEIQFFLDPQDKTDHPRFSEIKDMTIFVLTKDDQQKGKEAKAIKLNELKNTNKRILYYLARSVQLFVNMGVDTKKLRLRQHKDDERSFYSSDTWDVEFISDEYGRIELVGIADRTDYDLKRHMELSKADMTVNIDGRKFVPHVIEVAYGIDRPILCILESCRKEDGDRIFFSIPPRLAPYQVAIFPLVRKDGLPEKAKEVYNTLKKHFVSLYDEVGSIGRMYYRQDEVGTPFCITIDYDSIKNDDVTIRNRDNQRQIRVKISELLETMTKLTNGELAFEKAGKIFK